jgi:hypothetical protein
MTQTYLRIVPLVLALMLAAGLVAGSASAAGPTNTTCDGGTIAAGSYRSLTISGDCSLPDSGTVTVNGGLQLAPGSSLNGATPATLVVRGGVSVGSGAALVLGCDPEVGCEVTTQPQINGGLTANQALAVILHNATVRGKVSIQGGGGGVTCDPLLMGGPAYMDIENSQISGGATITGVESCWMGFIRNSVSGTVNISGNTLADPDAIEVVTNSIRGSLVCTGNDPIAKIGDSEGELNNVSGRKVGECAAL